MNTLPLDDVRKLVRQNRFGVLSLAVGGDAYGLPLFYAYDGGALYFHTLPGAKLRYMAATHEACFTISVVRTIDDWASAQVFGPLERVDGTPGELAAMSALMVLPLPPEFGLSPAGEPRHANRSPIYKMHITRMSGRVSARHLLATSPDEITTRGM